MTVKDVFELRRQGKIEEAYEAIRPIYASYRGKYTTLCMFWTASDVFKLRLEQKRVEEAEKIYEALKRLVPSIDDKSAAGFMHYAEGRLIKESEKFRKRYFAIKSKKKQPPTNDPFVVRAQDLTANEGINNPSELPHSKDETVEKEVELNKGQLLVLEAIKSNPGSKVPQIVEATNIPSKSIERHVKELISRHLIEHRGSKKTGGYYVK